MHPFTWHAWLDEYASHIPCSATQRLRLSVPAFAPLRYKTVHRTVLLNAPCPLSVRIADTKNNTVQKGRRHFLARLMRFERTTHSVGGCCSIQLSYRRIFKADRFSIRFYCNIFLTFYQAYFKSASQAANFTATQNTSIAIASSSVVG